jgi:hypothetical protein
MIDRTSMRALSTILESTSKRPKRGESSVSVFDVLLFTSGSLTKRARPVELNPNSAVEHEREANLERRRHPGVLFQSLFCRLAQRLILLTKFAQQRDLS